MKEFFELHIREGERVTVMTHQQEIRLGITVPGNQVPLWTTAANARALAGALLAAAQHIDPLPSTKPTPALTPDRLT